MGTLFRSEEMSLVQLYIPLEIAQPTVSELGELGMIEFRDLNPDVNAFQRSFIYEIRRLDEMERKLRFITTQTESIPDIYITPPDELSTTQTAFLSRPRSQQEVDELEALLNEYDAKLIQLNTSQESLNRRYLELAELKHVLRETDGFFVIAETKARQGAITEEYQDEYLERGEGSASLGFVTGVIMRSRMGIFERILFRALRGNLFMNYAEIDEEIVDPSSHEPISKNAFIIFAHGRELLAKIRKICESLGATIYPVNQDSSQRRNDAAQVGARLEDLNRVLKTTEDTKRQELVRAAQSLRMWEIVIKKEKGIYYTMNQFNYDQNRKALIAEGWCPTAAIPSVQYALRSVTERTGSTIPPLLNEMKTNKTPPTYHRTNRFTNAFQEIVDAYGVASYQEVNPGLFTTITFPFLFAVMFGDVGHGFLVALFAYWMVANEKTLGAKKWGEIWSTFFGGRYIILLMGLFSIFTGIIYNDIFSKAMNFGSGYTFVKVSNNTWDGHKQFTYAIGVDPAWHGSENSLLFSNSYKMKMAIVFGVMHMSFGICMNIYNHIHFKKLSNIYAEFVPQILFLLSIFGYLVFMIFFKWLSYYPDPSKAPGLLNTLIYMFLSPGSVSAENRLYSGQAIVQGLLLLLALICVPWMLLMKPYLAKKAHERHRGYADIGALSPAPDSLLINPNDDVHTGGGGADDEGNGHNPHEEMEQEEEFDFSEEMVHQMIHTIEFCLGAISNTASYLRLWALSLAHAQLSEVLWKMILNNALLLNDSSGIGQAIALYIAFSLWFGLTVAILLLMEGLSAFLHALRLHWVEFQNKFYAGAGKKFIPFSFKLLLVEEEE